MTEALAMPPNYVGPWTIDEVAVMPEDGMRHELVEGRLVVSPVPPPLHQNAGQRLIRILYAAAPLEFEVSPETNIRIGADMFIPDVMVARAESLSAPGSLYAEPKEVELPTMPRVTVYELRGTEYARIADARAGETLKLTEPF
jgi:hypothetical protein